MGTERSSSSPYTLLWIPSPLQGNFSSEYISHCSLSYLPPLPVFTCCCALRKFGYVEMTHSCSKKFRIKKIIHVILVLQLTSGTHLLLTVIMKLLITIKCISTYLSKEIQKSKCKQKSEVNRLISNGLASECYAMNWGIRALRQSQKILLFSSTAQVYFAIQKLRFSTG